MQKRYLFFVFWIILTGFVILWSQGDIDIYVGKKNIDEIAMSGWLSSSIITWELWVSPYGVEEVLLDRLSETTYSLDMWMYQITYDEVMTTLQNLWFLGVDIDIILENHPFGGSSKEYDTVLKKLLPVGVDIVTDDPMGTNFVHAKTIIIDDNTYIISTANLSYSSFRRNREYWFVGHQPAVIVSLQNIFDKDYVGESLSHKDIHPALLVCPLDCREKITDALWDAEEAIWIEAQYIEDESIVSVLRKKQLEGVDVRIITGKFQDEGWLGTFGTGWKMMDEYYLHAKDILIDGKNLLMWSMNLSTNALDNNREIGIVIDDEEVVKQFGKQFDRDRSNAKSLE